MNIRTHGTLGLLASGLLFLAGCGGGGGGGSGGGSVGTAALQGHVILNNGSTSNLGGVRLVFPKTGKTVTTASDGSFSFGSVPAGTLTVRLGAGLTALATVTPLAESGSGGMDGSGDVGDSGTEDTTGDDVNDDQGNDATDADTSDDGDDNDTGDDDFDVTSVAPGETVNLSIAVRDGIVESLDVSRSEGDCRESETRLERSVSSDDPDVTGKVETESRATRQRIKVEAEHVTSGRVLTAVLVAPDASEESLGDATANLEGEAKWDVNTADGDVLPFGAASVADLVGYGIEIRDQATPSIVLLVGTLPETPTSTEEPHGTRQRGRALLTAASGVSGEAHVEIEHRTGAEAHDEFKVEVEGLAAGTVVDVYLQNPATNALELVGTLSAGDEHDGELELHTGDGDVLPFGLTSVETLVGMSVELRDASGGAVLFSGTVPALVAD